MGCDVHMRVEVRDPATGEWQMQGEVFDSERESAWPDATPEVVAGLRVGQIADAVSYHANARGEGPTEFGRTLSEDLLAALKAHSGQKERDQATFKAKRNEAFDKLKQRDPDADYIGGTPEWEELEAFERDLTRARQDSFAVSAELEAELRRKVVEFDYGYEDEDGPSRMTLYLDRAAGDPPFKTAEPWDGRNYNLFSMLANVRNGYGFAGVPTGEGFVPIDMPRGAPVDASPEALEFLDSFGLDGHSQQWLTLEELDEFDWDGQETVTYGVVPAETYDRLKETGGYPTSYSGGISGHGIVTFTPESYETWVKGGKPPIKEPAGLWQTPDEVYDPPRLTHALRDASSSAAPGTVTAAPDALGPQAAVEPTVEVRPYVRMKWGETYRECAGEAWFRAMERMRELIPPNGSAADVRLVMFFDN